MANRVLYPAKLPTQGEGRIKTFCRHEGLEKLISIHLFSATKARK